MPEMFLGYALDIPYICLIYAGYMVEISLKNTWDITEICLRYASDSDIPEIYPRYALDSPRYAGDLFIISLK